MKKLFDMESGISVVMPVYNGEQSILYAIESVLKQSFENFELVIVDDGSTDDTCKIISGISDNRIRFFHHNHDYIKSLNIGISAANGKYIARMDADDYMHPDRLRFQWMFMEQHPEIDICSTWMQTFGLSHKIISNASSGWLRDIIYKLLYGNVICHPTVLMCNKRIKTAELYYEDYALAEDYKLWFEAAKKGFSFYVIPLVLHYYRQSKSQQTYAHFDMQMETSRKITGEIMEYIITRQTSQCLKEFLKSSMRMYRDGLMAQDDMARLFRSYSLL